MPVNLLLIEDDEDQALIIQDTLNSSSGDYEITILKDPLQLKLDKLDRFDVVVCDYNLPVKKGTEILRDILNVKEMPVIMLTGVEDSSVIIESFENGAQDYLIKSDNLLEILHFVIEKNLIDFKLKIENKEIRDARIRFEVRNKTMQQVITTLAHYINNSTTAISGFAQLCQFEQESKKVDKLFTVIQRETRKISAVLSELEIVADQMDVKTVHYVDLENGMFDIGKNLQKRLTELYPDESEIEESSFS